MEALKLLYGNVFTAGQVVARVFSSYCFCTPYCGKYEALAYISTLCTTPLIKYFISQQRRVIQTVQDG